MAIYTNNASNYIQPGTGSQYRFTGSFTLMAWVNFTKASGQQMFNKYRASAGLRAWQANFSRAAVDGKPSIIVYNSSDSGAVLDGTIDCSGGWKHVTWRHDVSAQKLAIFINGTMDNEGTGKANTKDASSIPLRLGVNNETTPTQPLNGSFFDARAYSVALSNDIIADIAAAYGRDGLFANMVLRMGIADGCVGLDSLSGKKVYDHSTNKNHVTATGAPMAQIDPYEPFLTEDA